MLKIKASNEFFASSSSVYGNLAPSHFHENHTNLQPISPYAATKLARENVGHVYSQLHDLTFIALRFFTVYGPRQRPDLAIHQFVRQIRNGEAILVHGDGSSSRDHTSIDDTVDGIMRPLDYSPECRFDIINAGNDRTIKLSDMIETIEQTLGCRARIERMPDQPGDVRMTCANIDKARTLLGYSPQTPFDLGVRPFVNWYDEHNIR